MSLCIVREHDRRFSSARSLDRHDQLFRTDIDPDPIPFPQDLTPFVVR